MIEPHVISTSLDLLTVAVFGLPGGWEVGILVALLLLLFGASRIPALARNLGKGILSFKKGVGELQNELKSAGELPTQDQAKGEVTAKKQGEASSAADDSASAQERVDKPAQDSSNTGA